MEKPGTPNERLDIFVKSINVTRTELAAKLGSSQPTISAILSGSRSLSRGMAARIGDHFPALNINWLLTGEGKMLKDTPKGKEELPEINYTDGVPYYDEDFVLGFNEIGFPSSENPQFLVQMPKYKNATLWCNATGNSMEPEINSGDVIALQLIEDPSFLLLGDLYAIVTTNGLRTIKRLGKSDDNDSYRLIPTNKAYDEQDIPKKMILRVFKVLGNLHSF